MRSLEQLCICAFIFGLGFSSLLIINAFHQEFLVKEHRRLAQMIPWTLEALTVAFYVMILWYVTTEW